MPPELLSLDQIDPNWAAGRWRLGADPGEPGGMSLPVALVFLHHTVTADTGDVIADVAKVCDIDQARFGKASYSWNIHEASYSWVEVEGQHRGAHTINNAQQSLNGVSFGLGVVGNFHPTANVPPPRPASDRLVHLIAEGIIEFLVKPGLVVPDFQLRIGDDLKAHRDAPYATACCGDWLYARLPEIRDLVAHPPPPPEVDMPSAPTVVEYQGHRRAYCRGVDGKLYEKIDNAAQWSPLGGALIGGPDACVDSLGYLHIFVRGTNNRLFHKFLNGPDWSGWEDLGGILTSAPNCYASVDAGGGRRIEVVVRGNDSGVYLLVFANEKWSGWANLGGLT
jgi:hypothetical protein